MPEEDPEPAGADCEMPVNDDDVEPLQKRERAKSDDAAGAPASML